MEIDGYRGDKVTFADTVQTSTASRLLKYLPITQIPGLPVTR